MNKEDKLKALDAAIAKIEKDHGKGSIMKLWGFRGADECRFNTYRFIKP